MAAAFVPLPPDAWRLVILSVALLALLLLGVAIAWQLVKRRYPSAAARARAQFERDKHLKLALWASGEQFWDYDLDQRTLHRLRAADNNGDALDISMVSRNGALPRIHDQDLPLVMERLRQHLQGSTPVFVSEHRMELGAPGHWVWVRARGRVVERDEAGRPTRMAGTARDITDNRKAEFERRIAGQVLSSMNEAVAVMDNQFHFIGFNPAFSELTGHGDEALGLPVSVLDSVQPQALQPSAMCASMGTDGRWSGEMWMRRKDGADAMFKVATTPVLDECGQPHLYVLVLNDITEQKRAEAELRHLASHDSLTHLPNRNLLSEHLQAAIQRARRGDTPLAVLFVDLDRFKDINDSLGHETGDRVLRAAAQRVKDVVEPHHTVARASGDEFIVVLEDTGRAEAERVASQIIAAFAPPLAYGGHQDVILSPSIGISLYPEHAHNATELLKHADTAMYQAKAAGRRTYEVYSSHMKEQNRRRVDLSNALRRALARDELSLAFQPRLSLRQQRITGVEALLRWNHPSFGEVPPSQFISLAEENGLILEIGAWALHAACKTLQQWRQAGLAELSMAVNVSAMQLMRGDLPHLVRRCLHDAQLPPNCLELELTESVIMARPSQNGEILQACRDLGVGLAIDDFGTGYSSLAYLKRLPITTLKIDREFVGDLNHDADDEAITSTIIAMGHSLDLKVIAEGVETTSQLQFLREHGCDEIQGFWVAQPMPAAECMEFIRGYRYGPPVKVVS